MVVEDSRAHAERPELLLILPGFVAAVHCAGPALGRLPALETLLARAERADGGQCDPLAALEACLPQLAGAARLPHAPLSRLADGGAQDDVWWSRADPVHLLAVRDHLRLVPEADITTAEAGALTASCNALLGEQGLSLEAPTPQRWYLRAPRPFEFTVLATDAIAGHDLFSLLPAGADGKYIRRLLTELQMVLHEHPVNERRERAGKLALNSIWLWGGGMLPASFAAAALPELWSDDPVVRGLWRLARAAAHAWPEDAAPAARGILVTRALQRAASGGDAARCAELLARLETQWLQPALAALRAGAIERARLSLGEAGAYALDRRALARWWRRAKPLAARFASVA